MNGRVDMNKVIRCSECDRTLDEIESEDGTDEEDFLFDDDLGVCMRCLNSEERNLRDMEAYYNKVRG
jgi:hypothetical protein